MKRFAARIVVSLFAALLTATTARSETKMCVVIHETHQTTAFDLEKRPVVSFTGKDVMLDCDDVTVYYPLGHYLKMTIEEVEVSTDVRTMADEGFRVTGSEITAMGGQAISLYTLDGRTVATGKPMDDGTATLSIGHLQTGTYIVVIGKKSFKINKNDKY